MTNNKTMRNRWFEFVAQTRRKLSRKEKREVSHRDAMKAASALWPKEKLKILNRLKRAERKATKELNDNAESSPKK